MKPVRSPFAPLVVCPCDEELEHFRQGLLNEPAFTQVADHLETCSHCISVLSAKESEQNAEFDQLLALDELFREFEVAAVGNFEATKTELFPDVLPFEIGRYELRSVIGEGGFGRVYAGFDNKLQRAVAVKLPRSRLFKFNRLLKNVLAEAHLVAPLDHPGIVSVFDVLTDDYPAIVMKLIDGESLSTRLRRTRPSLSQAVEWMIEIADAVQFAHQAGIVHRDLKPSNVLMTSQDKPCVVDFGIGIKTDSLTDLFGNDAGTVPYMAPERLSRSKSCDDKLADVWSLGVMLVELIGGVRPYREKNRDALAALIETQHPVLPSSLIDSGMMTIMQRCLARLPADRYSSAGEFADALKRWHRKRFPKGIAKWLSGWRLGLLLSGIGITVAAVGLSWQIQNRARAIASVLNEVETSDADRLPIVMMRLKALHVDPQLIKAPTTESAAFRTWLARAVAGDHSAEHQRALVDLLSRATPAELIATVEVLKEPKAHEPFVNLLESRLEANPTSELNDAQCHIVSLLANWSSESAVWTPHCAEAIVDWLTRRGCDLTLDMIDRELTRLPDGTRRLTASNDSAASELSKSGFAKRVQLVAPIGAQHLTPILLRRVASPESTSMERAASALALATFSADDSPTLIAGLLDAEPRVFQILVEHLRPLRTNAIKELEQRLDDLRLLNHRDDPAATIEDAPTSDEQREAQVVFALWELRFRDRIWLSLRHQSDLTVQTQIIHRFHSIGIPAAELVTEITARHKQTDALSRDVQFALLSGLALYPPEQLRQVVPDELLKTCWEQTVDSGIHSVTGLLARRMGKTLNPVVTTNAAAWFHDDCGHEFVVVEPHRARIGKHAVHPTPAATEPLVDQVFDLTYRFAIASTEVTTQQLEFSTGAAQKVDLSPSHSSAVPFGRIDLQTAFRYCNWCSQKANLTACYEAISNPDSSTTLVPKHNILDLDGYRLLTDREWEAASRAGAVTPRFIGRHGKLGGAYGLVLENPLRTVTPSGLVLMGVSGQYLPNRVGLFEMHGNAKEVTHFDDPLGNQSIRELYFSKSPAAPLIRGISVNVPFMMWGFDHCRTRYLISTTDPSSGFRVGRTLPAIKR